VKSSAVRPVTDCPKVILNTGETALLGDVGAVNEITAGPRLYVMLAVPLPDWKAE
jgi:hypothetical protein